MYRDVLVDCAKLDARRLLRRLPISLLHKRLRIPALLPQCPILTIAFLGDGSFLLPLSLSDSAPPHYARSFFLSLILTARVAFDWAFPAPASSYSLPSHLHSRKFGCNHASAAIGDAAKKTLAPSFPTRILSAEPFSPFSPAAPQDAPPTAGFHSRAKSVSSLAL